MWFNILKKKKTAFQKYQKRWLKKLRNGDITKEEFDKKISEYKHPKF